MNRIVKLCKGYKRLEKGEPLNDLLEPFYHMESFKPVLCATPWKMVHEEKSQTAVLLIHGYQGYPGEMSYLGLKLYKANFDVFCPRTPGHGVNQEDFLKTTKDDWLAVSRSTAGYLKKEYSSVLVVGHSMGGLIATIIADEFQIEKLTLISPAFKIHGFSKAKVKLLGLFKKQIDAPWQEDPSFWGICERDEGDDRHLGKEYWSKYVPKQLLELLTILEKATATLSKLKSKTLCVLGGSDDVVNSEKVEEILRSKVTSDLEIITIEGVNHHCQYFKEKDKRDFCNDSIVKFFTD